MTEVEDKLKRVDLEGSKRPDLPETRSHEVMRLEMKAALKAIVEAKANKGKGKGKTGGKGR